MSIPFIIITLHLTSLINAQYGICFWGRDSNTSIYLNGQFNYGGIHESRPYYTKTQHPSCGGSSCPQCGGTGNEINLFTNQGGWLISKGNGNTLSWASCYSPTGHIITDPTTACDDLWKIAPETNADQSVRLDYGECTSLHPMECESINVPYIVQGQPDQNHFCNANFNTKVGDYAWKGVNQNAANNGFLEVYFYFHPQKYQYICGSAHDLSCDLSEGTVFAISDKAWYPLNGNGDSFQVMMQSDHKELQTINCQSSSTPRPTSNGETTASPTTTTTASSVTTTAPTTTTTTTTTSASPTTSTTMVMPSTTTITATAATPTMTTTTTTTTIATTTTTTSSGSTTSAPTATTYTPTMYPTTPTKVPTMPTTWPPTKYPTKPTPHRFKFTPQPNYTPPTTDDTANTAVDLFSQHVYVFVIILLCVFFA